MKPLTTRKVEKVQSGVTLLTDYDVYLFREGNHFRLFEKLGAHVITVDKVKGTYFAVWAPNAKTVSVVGDFNSWDPKSHPLTSRWDSSGIWEGFIPGMEEGTLYKFHIDSNTGAYTANKGDPFAVRWEQPPATSPIVWNLDYEWNDREWMEKRKTKNSLNAPMSIYEVHLGSWKHKGDKEDDWLSYRELAPELTNYVKELGFTHVEFLPVMEHPFGG
ncbi:MAG: 1,4-alpha-glucan branching enzyme, partial [Fibrobacterota bacterium]